MTEYSSEVDVLEDVGDLEESFADTIKLIEANAEEIDLEVADSISEVSISMPSLFYNSRTVINQNCFSG